MGSMSGGSDFRKKETSDWGFDSFISTIQPTSSSVASTVAKGTAEVTSKLQHEVRGVSQQLQEKDIGSQLSSGWNFALGWASKTVKNITDVITEDDGVKLYNKDAVSTSGKKMESKSSKDFFLGGQRGISSNTYFENPSSKTERNAKKAIHNNRRTHLVSPKQNAQRSTSVNDRNPQVLGFQSRSPQVKKKPSKTVRKKVDSNFGFSDSDDDTHKTAAKPAEIVDDSESFGFSEDENFAQPIKSKSSATIPNEIKDGAGKSAGDSGLNSSYKDILGGVSSLSCKQDANPIMDSGEDDDENW